jgi:hypothetical protein
MSDGFIQFGDGEPIPVTDISWTLKREAVPDYLRLPLLGEFEASLTAPISSWAASGIMRAVGDESMADRIDFEAHPDLAELNVQMDGYYGDQP